MNLDEIKTLIEKDNDRSSRVSLYDIGRLRQMTTVDFVMDRDSGEYHYEVSIDGIKETDASKEILSNYTWALNDDNKLVINNI